MPSCNGNKFVTYPRLLGLLSTLLVALGGLGAWGYSNTVSAAAFTEYKEGVDRTLIRIEKSVDIILAELRDK